MASSEPNKTLAAALQSARALSNQTLVRPKEAAAKLGALSPAKVSFGKVNSFS